MIDVHVLQKLRWFVVAVVAVAVLFVPGTAFAASGPTTPKPTGNIGFTVVPGPPSPTPTKTGPPSAGLPNTGGPSYWWLGLAAGLLAAGGGAVVVARRPVQARH